MNGARWGVLVRFALLLSVFLALASPSPSLAHGPFPQGVEVRTATSFLMALEDGRMNAAFALLSPESQQAFGIGALDPRTALGRRGGYTRSFVSIRPLPQRSLANFGVRQPSARYRYQLVCFVESPVQGFGIVRYIAVVVGRTALVPRSFVMSYRIESSLSNCA
jgi:hypothetical protein